MFGENLKREDLRPAYTRVAQIILSVANPHNCMKSTIKTGPLLNIRPSEGSKQSERASRAVVRWSRKRMREELEGENVETTEDQPMETESRRIKDVGTQTMLSGDVFKATMSTAVACYKICSLVIQSLLIEARTLLLFIRLT